MKKQIWLFLSGFGIMFAVFSWLQESSLIPVVETLGWQKGLFALITGTLLYLVCRDSL
tara:strand:+ start:994 stop:1167 length:174 start_codon:yes stop_codon:yes gene_type:complete